MKLRLLLWFFAASAGAITAGCSYEQIFTDPVLKEARRLNDEGQTDRALAMLEKAMADYPGQHVYRTEFFRQRDLAVARWLAQAEALLVAGQFDLASEVYRRVQKYDPASVRARVGLAQIEAEMRHRTIIANAEKLAKENKFLEAEDTLRPVLVYKGR